MFKNLFNPDNALMITMSQVTDCLFLSMFWLLGCVPVVTVGVSTAALYDAVYHGLRKGEKNSWQRFFASYRRNLKGGILPGILLVAVILLGGWGMIQCWNAAVYAEVSWKVFSVAMLLGVLVLGVLSVLPPMLSRFENSTAQLLKNTLFLSLANPVGTLLLGALNAGTAALCFFFVIPVFFLPALGALLGSLIIEPMFKPYMNMEDAAA